MWDGDGHTWTKCLLNLIYKGYEMIKILSTPPSSKN